MNKSVLPAFVEKKIDKVSLRPAMKPAKTDSGSDAEDDLHEEPKQDISDVGKQANYESISDPGNDDAHAESDPEEEASQEIEIEDHYQEIYPAFNEDDSRLDDADHPEKKTEEDPKFYKEIYRTHPDEVFPVQIFVLGSWTPANLTSPVGFVLDIHNGKLEIKQGDLAHLAWNSK